MEDSRIEETRKEKGRDDNTMSKKNRLNAAVEEATVNSKGIGSVADQKIMSRHAPKCAPVLVMPI